MNCLGAANKWFLSSHTILFSLYLLYHLPGSLFFLLLLIRLFISVRASMYVCGSCTCVSIAFNASVSLSPSCSLHTGLDVSDSDSEEDDE